MGSSLEVVDFAAEHAGDAAAMFLASRATLRRAVPVLPDPRTDTRAIADELAGMSGFAALRDGRLAGFLTSWFPIEGFRGADRIGAYAPEWAHGGGGLHGPRGHGARRR